MLTVIPRDARRPGPEGSANADPLEKERQDDVAAFARALGLQKFNLLGLSMGGIIVEK